METVITEILRILVNYPAIIFCIAGYFVGSLFRDISILKIIVLLFVLPFCIEFLIELNNLQIATVPFLAASFIGYWGKERTQYYAANAFELVREQIERLR